MAHGNKQGEIAPFGQRLKGVLSFVDRYKDRIEQVLPKHLTPERMIALATGEIQRTPRLLDCDPGSVVGAVVAASELGLEFGARQHAHLVPYKIKGRYRCQLLIDYRGLAVLAEQHPDVRAAWAYVVRADDEFAHELGTNPRVTHKPSLTAQPDPKGDDIVAAYGVVDLHTGRQLVEVLPRWEIDKVRASSRASNDGPWATWYERQARKTALRRVLNLVASTGAGAAANRLAQAVRMDEAVEVGKAVVDVEPQQTTRAGGSGSVLDDLAEQMRGGDDDSQSQDSEQQAREDDARDWDPFAGLDDAAAPADDEPAGLLEAIAGCPLGPDGVRELLASRDAWRGKALVDLPLQSLRAIMREINTRLDAEAQS